MHGWQDGKAAASRRTPQRPRWHRGGRSKLRNYKEYRQRTFSVRWAGGYFGVVAPRDSSTAFVNCSVFAFPPTSFVVNLASR